MHHIVQYMVHYIVQYMVHYKVHYMVHYIVPGRREACHVQCSM